MVTRDGSGPTTIKDAKEVCLQNISVHHRTADAAHLNRVEAISMAIRFGATWEEIGAAMGMTKQMANKRFAKLVS